MGIYKDKAEQLEKTCKEQGEKIRELKAKLEDRNSKIAELESELSVKEGLLNIKNGLNTGRLNDRKKEFDKIFDMFTDYMEDYNKSGVIRFLAELTQKLRENGVMYTVESFGGEINVKDIEIHLEEDCVKSICENIPNYESFCRELQDQHQSDCITINQLNVCIDILCDKYSRLREIHGL